MPDEDITLNNQTVKRMLGVAESFKETPDSIINRLLDFFISHREGLSGAELSRAGNPDHGAALDPFAPPSLRHTKLIFAKLEGREIPAPSWNGLAEESIRIVWKKLGSFSALQKRAPANMVQGCKQNQGYRYLKDLDISIQGQDANDAWRCVARLARTQNFRIEVGFIWRDVSAAARPGETGHMAIGGLG
jgi:hypothetical protein